MTIEKVPDCVGVMKFRRMVDGKVLEPTAVDSLEEFANADQIAKMVITDWGGILEARDKLQNTCVQLSRQSVNVNYELLTTELSLPVNPKIFYVIILKENI